MSYYAKEEKECKAIRKKIQKYTLRGARSKDIFVQNLAMAVERISELIYDQCELDEACFLLGEILEQLEMKDR